MAKGDPRKSLQERYKNHEGYVDAVQRAAGELVRERFLLSEDADRFISDAKASSVLKVDGNMELSWLRQRWISGGWNYEAADTKSKACYASSFGASSADAPANC